ncbi:MAG TPA: hypothetical protein VGL35_00900 [Rhizomicrobium sp.]
MDARDAAQAAARREGLPLGEWLTRRILKRYSELNSQEREEAFSQLGHRVSEVTGRLEHLEIEFRSAPMREAIKKLHQGLGRLTNDVVQSTGQSTIRISALSRNVEEVLEKIEEIRGAAAQAGHGFDRRIDAIQKGLDAAAESNLQKTDALAQRLDRLTHTLDDAFGTASRNSNALQSQLAHVVQDVQGLDGRLGEAQQRTEEVDRQRHEQVAGVTDRLENFGVRLDRVCAATAESANGLHAQMQELRDKLDQLDLLQKDQLRTIADRTESLDGKIAEAATDAAGMCGALDHRLLLVQQNLQILDSRQAETSEALERGRGWVAEKIAEVRTGATAACASLDERLAATQQVLQDFERRQSDAIEALSETRRNQGAATSAVQALEGGIVQLQTRLSNIESDTRAASFEQQLQELTGRTGAVESGLGLLQEHATSMGVLLNGIESRTDTESRNQHDGLQELKLELLDEVSRSLGAHLDAEACKQERSLEELHANFAANTLRLVDEKLEEGARKQQLAMAQWAAELPPVAPPAEPEHQPAESESATSAAEPAIHEMEAPQDSILDLTTPATEVPDPEYHRSDDGLSDAPPHFAEPALAVGTAMGALSSAASEPLEPVTSFARDTASEPGQGSASFLSAARQSLKAAAQKTEADSGAKTLFGFQFLRHSTPTQKGRSDATSYALLAGVALVAILAIAITASELVKRSAPASVVQRTSATLATGHIPHGARRKPLIAVAKVATAPKILATGSPAGTPRLPMLAKAGDPQAQMLLGLQELGTDKTDAAKWLQAAAVQGMPVAQYRLATLYAQGHGVQADAAKAFQWYAAAAKGGNRKAMSNLALAYAQGSGTAKDPQEAARWFSKAAALGLVDAQFDLAVLYERGLGVPQSLIDAYRWYLVAAKAGDQESKDRVDALSSQLSTQDRAAAEAAAAQFKPLPLNPSANEPQ